MPIIMDLVVPSVAPVFEPGIREMKVKTPGKTDDVARMDGTKPSAFYMEGQLHAVRES